MGRKETEAASTTSASVAAGRRTNSSSRGKTTTAHGKSKGKSLTLVAVKKAADRIESQRSAGRREVQARRPKSTAAKA